MAVALRAVTQRVLPAAIETVSLSIWAMGAFTGYMSMVFLLT